MSPMSLLSRLCLSSRRARRGMALALLVLALGAGAACGKKPSHVDWPEGAPQGRGYPAPESMPRP
ncbi:MAG: hypothetical protein IPI58_08115 [Alphaproteobacteria bacterium]|nr:MAG: hypothetical protein IPI58_08115 [Alphaproteobacteria bacterium]